MQRNHGPQRASIGIIGHVLHPMGTRGPLRMESGYHYELTHTTMMKKVEREIL